MLVIGEMKLIVLVHTINYFLFSIYEYINSAGCKQTFIPYNTNISGILIEDYRDKKIINGTYIR